MATVLVGDDEPNLVELVHDYLLPGGGGLIGLGTGMGGAHLLAKYLHARRWSHRAPPSAASPSRWRWA